MQYIYSSKLKIDDTVNVDVLSPLYIPIYTRLFLACFPAFFNASKRGQDELHITSASYIALLLLPLIPCMRSETVKFRQAVDPKSQSNHNIDSRMLLFNLRSQGHCIFGMLSRLFVMFSRFFPCFHVFLPFIVFQREDRMKYNLCLLYCTDATAVTPLEGVTSAAVKFRQAKRLL